MAVAMPALAVDGVSKVFGATRALDNVSLRVEAGEIHALCGGNGSGKSTLIKILTGVYRADDGGTVQVGTETVAADSLTARASRDLGIRVVHQDLGIFRDMSVAENLSLGRGFEAGPAKNIAWSKVRRRCTELLERNEVLAHPEDRLGSLPHAVQAQIAIARALQDVDNESRAMLILDEPTTALPAHEVHVLFTALRRHVARGHSILFVSHRMDEIRQIATGVTVFRDGRTSGSWPLSDLSDGQLIEQIVGARLSQTFPETARSERASREVLLEVNGMRSGPVSAVDLHLERGEIVGIAGLLGSGRSEILRAVQGTDKVTRGSIRFRGVEISRLAPSRRRDLGIAYVPEDRVGQSVFPGQTVADNMLAPSLRGYWKRGFLRRRKMDADAAGLISRFRVRAQGPKELIDNLSGGNQQKAVVARWLSKDPDLLLLDEPTQGVDVGARADIYQQIRTAVDNGAAALLVAADFEELAHVADRVVLLRDGSIQGELAGESVTPDRVAGLVYGQSLGARHG